MILASCKSLIARDPTRQDGRPKRGVSLIELVIVLLVLIGALAIVWPALNGPLASNDLRQAAETLRTQLADARSLALRTGQPIVVQIDREQQMIVLGQQQDVLEWLNTAGRTSDLTETPTDQGDRSSRADETAVGRDEPALGPADTSGAEGLGNVRLQTWTLPPGLIWGEVQTQGSSTPRWNVVAQGFVTPPADVSLGGEAGSSESRGGGLEVAPALADERALDDTQGAVAGSDTSGLPRRAWLCFLPQGQLPETVIQLIDVRTQRWLTVTLDAWSGTIVIGPPQRIDWEVDETSDEAFGDETDSLTTDPLNAPLTSGAE